MKTRLLPEVVYAHIARSAFVSQGFSAEDAEGMARYLVEAKRAGNSSHDLRKMLHLRHLFGDLAGKPGGELRVLSKNPVIARWDCGLKLGPGVIYSALETAIEAAKAYGVGIVSGLNFSHYGCGHPYIQHAVDEGFIALLWSTASLAEVVPYGGKRAATGTNAWTLGIPIEGGKHFVLDMATASMARGAIQALEVRAKMGEKVSLQPDTALDADGNVTLDPTKVVSLLPFGRHKGGGLSIFSELLGGIVGGGRPSVRCQAGHKDHRNGERQSTSFVLQVLDPKELWCGSSDCSDYAANVREIVADIFSNGNEDCMLPGEIEQCAIAESDRVGGLRFDDVEINVLDEIVTELGIRAADGSELKVDSVAKRQLAA